MRSSFRSRSTSGGWFVPLLYVFLLVGYVKNIVKLCQCDFEPKYKAEILYGVGTVTGLGVIFGWIDFGK